MFSYKPLFVKLTEMGETKTNMRKKIGISTATLAAMSKNEYVSLATIDKICKEYGLAIEDVIQYIDQN